MRSLRAAMLALGAPIGAAGLVGLAETSCGDDTSGSRTASLADATTDGEPRVDAGGGSTTDVASGADVSEGSVDAQSSLALVFATNEATAVCTAFLNCCPGRLDAGTYDLQHCIDDFKLYGWEAALPRDMRVYSRGHITFDSTQAARCISATNAFPCGMQTAAQWGAITSACELVIQGTIPSNSAGCISSFECAPGNYCDPTVDGGLCTPLAKQGQPCNTKINDPTLGYMPLADEMCSYLSSGRPPLFCDMINNPPDAATCQPLLPDDASCTNSSNGYYDDQACKPPGLCGNNLKCGGNGIYPYTAWCQSYQIQDGGGPG